MLVAVGQAEFQLGDLDGALDHYQAALEGARAIGDYQLESASLQQLGAVKQSMGDAGAAQLYYSDALDVAIDRDDDAGEMRASAGLGSFYLELGAHERARDFYQRALLLAERLGAQRTGRIVLGYLGVLAFDGSAYEEAESLLARAADRSRASETARRGGLRGHPRWRSGLPRFVDQSARSLYLADRLLEPTPFFRTVVSSTAPPRDPIAREYAQGRHRWPRPSSPAHARGSATRGPARCRLSSRSDDARIAVRILERAIDRPPGR